MNSGVHEKNVWLQGGIELDSARIIKAIGRAGYTARELQDANPSDQVEL